VPVRSKEYVVLKSLLRFAGFMIMETPEWFKIKGYYHLSPQISGDLKSISRVVKKIKNPKYVENYAFYPLLHVNIKERKYKKHPNLKGIRCHSYFDKGKFEKTVKIRPLHYANHTDALIFSYYAFELQKRYELKLKENLKLSDCITAYRKIPVLNSSKNKGSIDFAHDAFQEIKKRTLENNECAVLAFDIKSFFPSLNHQFLEDKWKELMNFKELPKDHQNVLKAATKFSFLYKNDLKKYRTQNSKRAHFDERNLAKIRNLNGFKAYFASPKAFREAMKSGEVRLYKNQFKSKETNEMIGIPQGLPISAILANLYLLDFDKTIFNSLVENENCYYRRYSDDIVIVCSKNQIENVKQIVENEMRKCKVIISTEKTETFLFNKRDEKILSSKLVDGFWIEGLPFVYLGFEFYGHKTLIKSTNLSKFYRRMIYSVKLKCKRAIKASERQGGKPILFKRQLYKIYRNINLDSTKIRRRFTKLVKQETGDFRIESKMKKSPFQGNYFNYARRASEIMNEPAILKQIEGEKRVFNQAFEKHLKFSR
jgi:hypothetical protein